MIPNDFAGELRQLRDELGTIEQLTRLDFARVEGLASRASVVLASRLDVIRSRPDALAVGIPDMTDTARRRTR